MFLPSPEPEEPFDVTALQPLDDTTVAWDRAVEVTYLLHQRFRYDYPGPIADLHHRLIVVPRERHGDQVRIATRLDVNTLAAEHAEVDDYGNPVTTFFARRVDGALEFNHWSLVRRTGVGRTYEPPDDVERWLRPTVLTACDEPLREAARTLRERSADASALAAAIGTYVHREMRYVAGATTVETTASEAFAQRSGVCQDYAHVALALARRCGLAARYVSGHLIGEGGTHAWVEFLVPCEQGLEVIDFDPTHDCRLSMRYVVVSVGRDYADVAPTSGVFTAPYGGELTATKRVGATEVRYAGDAAEPDR